MKVRQNSSGTKLVHVRSHQIRQIHVSLNNFQNVFQSLQFDMFWLEGVDTDIIDTIAPMDLISKL